MGKDGKEVGIMETVDEFLKILERDIEVARATCSHETTGLLRAKYLYERYLAHKND